jgi:hypothetical protein
MLRLIYWILSLCLLIGVGDAFVRLTLQMAGAAVYAHQHQLSYAAFTRAMLNAKPRQPQRHRQPQNQRR